MLKEQLELRTIRGTLAARATLEAGFTTIRELGTEGAAFADVADGVRRAVRQQIAAGADLGRAAPGYTADLVAVEGDPLSDVSSLRRPVVVFRNGRPVVDRRRRD